MHLLVIVFVFIRPAGFCPNVGVWKTAQHTNCRTCARHSLAASVFCYHCTSNSETSAENWKKKAEESSCEYSTEIITATLLRVLLLEVQPAFTFLLGQAADAALFASKSTDARKDVKNSYNTRHLISVIFGKGVLVSP